MLPTRAAVAEYLGVPAAAHPGPATAGHPFPPPARAIVGGVEARDGTTLYVLHQRFRYDYAGPVRNLRHRLMIVPRSVHGDQRRLAHRVGVTGAPALVSVGLDGFGNH